MRNNNKFRILAVFAIGLAISGCMSEFEVNDNRGNVPIPAKLQAEMRKNSMSAKDPVLVRIFKQESELELWKQDKSGKYALLKTYPMCRWSGKLGPKTTQGDRQAPEGFYTVDASRLNPASKFHLSFNLGYPNRLERAKGYSGSALMVHGACSSAGCYAISDDYVSELYAVVRDALKGGQRSFQVQAYPFRMTAENLAIHRKDPNFDFWMDLKDGYDRFEVLQQPPSFTFCDGRYRFGKPKNAWRPNDPMAACPAFEPEPLAVASRTAGDLSKMEELLGQGHARSFVYEDGGMHPIFRKVLTNRGSKFLSRKTSTTSVPVSRPTAALADPYKVDEDEAK
ncbi:MAG: murein L,D-transpeptidase family protein [Pseudomonadota bacterium]